MWLELEGFIYLLRTLWVLNNAAKNSGRVYVTKVIIMCIYVKNLMHAIVWIQAG